MYSALECFGVVTSSSIDHMSTAGIAVFAEHRNVHSRIWIGGATAVVAWLVAALLTALWPDKPDSDWEYTQTLAALFAAGAAVLAVTVIAGLRLTIPEQIRRTGLWLVALAVLAAVWEIVTAKLGLLPMPFFPPPQALLEVMIDDWKRLLESVVASLKLLAGGYLIGAAVGFLIGVAIGWSRPIGYWIHPILRVVGPLPATAWLPIAFFVFPSSLSASMFLIALATGFPVAVLTWSGVAGISNAYYDVARTLGASRWFLVVQVAIPAALPHVFVGLFMGLGNSFAVLVVAEMLGVKSGLGWYLQWAQGWAAYSNMYAALLIMALVCSGLITLLFRMRDSLLSWQKGLVRW
jgi:NitT/TauT family transport system permease protein